MTAIATHIFHAFSAYFAPARTGGPNVRQVMGRAA